MLKQLSQLKQNVSDLNGFIENWEAEKTGLIQKLRDKKKKKANNGPSDKTITKNNTPNLANKGMDHLPQQQQAKRVPAHLQQQHRKKPPSETQSETTE